jgi:hypothetical protein
MTFRKINWELTVGLKDCKDNLEQESPVFGEKAAKKLCVQNIHFSVV